MSAAPEHIPGIVRIGIDPGLAGAVAVVDDDQVHEVWDMPTEPRTTGKGRRIDARELLEGLQPWRHCRPHVHVEVVSTRGRESAQSAVAIGDGAGVIRCALIALGLAHTWVRPQDWQRAAGLPKVAATASKAQRKRRSIARALEVYPDARDLLQGPRGGELDGRADAILIARFGASG